MNPAWFVRHDWPMDEEIQRRKDLMDAILAIPGQESRTDQNT
jgi:hypothetical protein